MSPIDLCDRPGPTAVSTLDREQPPNDALHARLIERRVVSASAFVTSRLRCHADEVLLTELLVSGRNGPRWVRTTYHHADDPTELARRYAAVIAADPVPDLAATFSALFGVELGSQETTLQAVRCEDDTARLLGVPVGVPVLLRETAFFDTAGVGRALSFVHLHPDHAEEPSRPDCAG